MKTLFLVLISAFAISSMSHAFEIRHVSFTAQEKAQHKAGLAALTSAASRCLYDVNDYQNKFFAQNRFSPFYGDLQKSFISWNLDQRVDYLVRNTQQSIAQVRSEIATIQGSKTDGANGALANMSCVGLVMRCLKAGFMAAHQENLWQQVEAYTAKADYDGTALQASLQGLGWKVYYWDPDLSKNAEWDQQELQSSEEYRGYHVSRYSQVQRTGNYYENVVDDAKAMVNFGTTTPAVLKAAPFFVATAHTGYHVFSGYKGMVVEGHAGRGALAADIVEAGIFSPLTARGKPSGQMYRSGLIALPPAF